MKRNRPLLCLVASIVGSTTSFFGTAATPAPIVQISPAAMPRIATIDPRYQSYNSVAPGSVGIQTYEGIIEIDYGARITPWLALRPNLQYVIHPGATANALIAGLYAQVTF